MTVASVPPKQDGFFVPSTREKPLTTKFLLKIFDDIGVFFYGEVPWVKHVTKALSSSSSLNSTVDIVLNIFQTQHPIVFGSFSYKMSDEKFGEKINTQKIVDNVQKLEIEDLMTLLFFAVDHGIEDLVWLFFVNQRNFNVPVEGERGLETALLKSLEKDYPQIFYMILGHYSFEQMMACNDEDKRFENVLKMLIQRLGYERVIACLLMNSPKLDWVKGLRKFCIIKILCIAVEEKNLDALNRFYNEPYIRETLLADFNKDQSIVQLFGIRQLLYRAVESQSLEIFRFILRSDLIKEIKGNQPDLLKRILRTVSLLTKDVNKEEVNKEIYYLFNDPRSASSRRNNYIYGRVSIVKRGFFEEQNLKMYYKVN
jgi:hypothetical protein